jgi:nondiscriminating aspartyl-tRNA synthetase
MSKLSILEAKKQAKGEVLVAGFVHNLRLHKGVAFLDLRDRSAIMQLVIEEKCPDFSKLSELSLESVISVAGTLQEKPRKKNQPEAEADYELLVNSLELLSKAQENLPFSVLKKINNEAGSDLRFNYRWLDLRSFEKQLIFKVWTKLEEAFRQEFSKLDFIQIYSPSLMNTASEGGAEFFKVKYFERSAYLAQSPQFYKQMAMAAGLEKVFTFGPVFRAEASFTNRHLTEFTGWDFELSYIKSHIEVMEIEEKIINQAFLYVKEKLNLDIEVPDLPFPKLSMKEAKEKLKKRGISSEKAYDLSPEEERALSQLIKEEKGHDFVFITDYPIEARPFYHMRYEDNPQLTMSFDLLYKGIEITTGSMREHRLDYLKKQAIEKGVSLDDISEYLKFFSYGCPPHGGVGIGPARIIMKLLGYDNIKEVCYLPRDVKRLIP